jgi:hypothetical protein
MNRGIQQNYQYAAAGTLSERRLSVFRNTLKLVVALRKSAMKTSVRGRRVS